MKINTFRIQFCHAAVFVTFLLLLVGCKDEKDTRFPEIIYYSPQFRQEFQVSDTVDVKAMITDEEVITAVKVNLTNDQFITASEVRTFMPGMPSFSLDTRIPTDNESLESGTYYVLIRAENGLNYKNKYQEIYIRGAEQEFIQMIVITDRGSNETDVSGSDDFETIHPLFTVQGDYAASAISHDDGLLFVAGRDHMNLRAYQLENNSLSWSKEVTPGKPVHNDDCLCFGELLYVTYNYNYIQGYTPQGQIAFNVFTEEFDAPGNIHKHGDFILVDMQKKNANDPYMATYFATTGNEKQRRLIDFDITGFHSLDENNVLVAANRNGYGIIYLYDVTANILTLKQELQEGINATSMADNGKMILAGNMHTYLYSAASGQLVSILDDGALTMCYEHVSGSLILGSSLKIDVYKFPEMVNQKTLLFSDTILDILVQYSK